MKNKKIKKKNLVQCPCCKTYVGKRDQSHIHQAYQKLVEQRGEHYISYQTLLKHRNWACDGCLQSGKAAKANFNKLSNRGYDLPFFAYYLKERTCRDCHIDFDFTIKEQKFWYEEQKIETDVIPVRCASCRKARRKKIASNNRIMELTAIPNKTIDHLKELAELYRIIGSERKAIESENQCNNLLKNSKKD